MPLTACPGLGQHAATACPGLGQHVQHSACGCACAAYIARQLLHQRLVSQPAQATLHPARLPLPLVILLLLLLLLLLLARCPRCPRCCCWERGRRRAQGVNLSEQTFGRLHCEGQCDADGVIPTRAGGGGGRGLFFMLQPCLPQ